MTGLSESEQLNIGTNINKILREKIKRLNEIKANNNIPIKIKKKNEKIINRKIYNMVDEIHWKTINFLIHNFRNILLGDMIFNINQRFILNIKNIFILKE